MVEKELLGKGAYGTVYKEKYKEENVAIKYISSDKYGYREISELIYLRCISHPSILHSDYTPVFIEKQMGIILPLAISDLHNYVKTNGVQSPKINKIWSYEMISAIHFLHKNSLYHCDIKPENALIIPQKDGMHLCLSDLGFVGRVEFKSEICGTLYAKSPQRLYSERFKLGSSIIGNKFMDVWKLPSNEYQDDVWALGILVYYILVGRYSFGLSDIDVDYWNVYIKDPIHFLTFKKVPSEYMNTLIRLLNPIPIERSLNLLELLSEPVYNSYVNLLDGDMIQIKNDTPVIFNHEKSVLFSEDLMYIKTMCDDMGGVLYQRYHIIFNAIDLYYRIFEKHSIYSRKQRRHVCVILLLKIYNLHIYAPADRATIEAEIITQSEGLLIRETVMAYLNTDQYETCVNWIIKNPDRYEQCTPQKLAEVIRSL